MNTFDTIIVGAGSAASVVAARLAEDGKRTLCVLEAGPPDTNPYIRIPAGFMKTLFDPSVTWQFKTEASEHIAGREIALVQGRTLGGSSAVNGGLIVGQPALGSRKGATIVDLASKDYIRWGSYDASSSTYKFTGGAALGAAQAPGDCCR